MAVDAGFRGTPNTVPCRRGRPSLYRFVVSDNGWLRMIEENPGHSAWYIERFRSMAAEGQDLDGEARFVDAMAPRGARILDAGCGPGRVGGRLATLGHQVVGVDIDPALIAAAEGDHPGATWLVRDLAVLDLAPEGVAGSFDVIVSAGNVMPFLDPATRREVLHRLAAHLAADGRLAVGFGADRGYGFDEFFADAASVGIHDELRLSTWDLRPFDMASSTFLVAVLTSP
ncbi:MAG: class I SAM-dependent methyltransferase [Acidimicrobiales bacterium]|nr:class I SAM-dependent methyltransferase [Acidimicrobiales bacterium]